MTRGVRLRSRAREGIKSSHKEGSMEYGIKSRGGRGVLKMSCKEVSLESSREEGGEHWNQVAGRRRGQTVLKGRTILILNRSGLVCPKPAASAWFERFCCHG